MQHHSAYALCYHFPVLYSMLLNFNAYYQKQKRWLLTAKQRKIKHTGNSHC